MPNTITIREVSFADPVFQFALSVNGDAEYEVTLTSPANAEQESHFEWYFEQFLRYPMLDTVKAAAIVDEIRQYGEALFNGLFEQRAVFAAYQTLKNGGLDQLEFVLIGKSTRFHSLHWEALKDPDLPLAFAAGKTNVFRKNSRPAGTFVPPAPSPVLNLLLVVARPHWEDDVSYRTITRPIIDLIESARLRVDAHILRPGTYQQLVRHLDEKPAGFYHLIHFDTHGALLDYATYQQLLREQTSPTPHLMQARWGLPEPAAYAGKQAFLLFEGDEKGQSVPVNAQELADLLTTRNVPICLLNACQSAKEAEADYQTSLAAKLMETGVQAVLGQRYSITVTAAEVLMKRLYETLFAQASLNNAVANGRRELALNKSRRAYFNRTVDLEDWLLPVYYQNRPVSLALRDFTPDEEEGYYLQQEATYQPAPLDYGFVGRDLDILTIEKRLQKHNMLLLRGMGGTGKTTLLDYLAQWWERTGWVKKTIYFGYDKRAYTLPQILDTIARQLLDKRQYAQFQASSPVAQRGKIVELLTTEAYCLIFDNCESITGTALAIQNTLPADDQERLRDFLARLRQQPDRPVKSYVLLGSRSDEGWLAPTTFGTNVYALAGLDPEARTTLARRILGREGLAHADKDADFGKLMTLLAGYPLAMKVILPNLRQKTAAALIGDLKAGDVTLDSKGDTDKTTSILRCVDYSHSNLSPEAQRVLLCLAPFSGYVSLFALDAYFDAVQQQAPFGQASFANWRAVFDEAVAWGLMEPISDGLPVYQLQPVFPYFLNQKLQPDAKPALDTAFRTYYDSWADTIYQLLDSKEPQQKQAGLKLARWEYENLYTALQLSLSNQQSILNPYRCLSDYIDAIHDEPAGLALAQTVLRQLETYPAASLTGPLGAELVGVIDNGAKRFLLTKQFDQAKAAYEKALSIHLDLQGFPPEYIRKKSASIYHQLGVVAEEQRQWPQAHEYHQQALAIKIEFNNRNGQASTYHQLGFVAQEQRQWPQANDYYQQALAIKIELNNRYSQASTYHQLGIVAQQQRQWSQANDYYQQALAILIEFSDEHNEQIVRNSLQRLADERDDIPQ